MFHFHRFPSKFSPIWRLRPWGLLKFSSLSFILCLSNSKIILVVFKMLPLAFDTPKLDAWYPVCSEVKPSISLSKQSLKCWCYLSQRRFEQRTFSWSSMKRFIKSTKAKIVMYSFSSIGKNVSFLIFQFLHVGYPNHTFVIIFHLLCSFSNRNLKLIAF